MDGLFFYMIRLLLGIILETRIFIAICAVCMTLASLLILHGGSHGTILICSYVFCATFIVYNANVFPAMARFFNGTDIKEKFQVLAMAACLGYVTYYFWSFSLTTKLFIFHLGALSLLYYLPVSGKLGNWSLRNIPFIKIFLISYVWAAVTVLLPWMNKNYVPESAPDLWILFLERFIFIFAITVPFDIRDLEKDKKENVRTIPSIIGVHASKILSYLLLLTYLGLTWQQFGIGTIFFARVVCAILLSFAIAKIDEHSENYYFTGILDGGMILQYVLLVIFT